MNLRVFIDWQLDPVKRLLAEVPNFIESQINSKIQNVASPEGLTSSQLYRAVHSIALNAVIYEINSIVDFVLLSLANGTQPEDERVTFSAMSRSRQRSIIEIEKHHALSLETLEGWSFVEQVREQSNALKHRGG